MKMSEVFNEYSRAVSQANQFQPIFREYQRLAANKVLTRSNNSNPFPYGEGTAASLIRKMPQRVLKQIPTGKIRNITDEWNAVLNEYIIEDIFIRNFRRNDGFIQTLWNMMESGMTFGWSTCTTFFTYVNGAYTVDFKPHYWADVYPVVGSTNLNTGNVFIVDWWTPRDIESLKKMAKDDNTINLREIDLILKGSEDSRQSQNQSEVNKQAAVNNLGYKVIRYYVTEDGKNMLYIFRENAKEFIQKKELPSRGVVTFYYSHDSLTAYGRSILALIGGIQIDLNQAMYAKRRVQEFDLNPMAVFRGAPINKFNLRPGTKLELPMQADVSFVSIESRAALNYNADHSAGQALIYQLAGYPEANVSAGSSGASEIGQTPAAIRQAQANMDNADNQVSLNLKLFIEQLLTDALKIYYSNMPDEFLIEVSEQYARRLYDIDPTRFVNPTTVIATKALDLFDYEIDIESSRAEVNAQKLDAVMKMIGMLEQSPMLSQRVAALGIVDDLIKEVIFASGLNNDQIAKKLAFLSNPNLGNGGQPGGDPYGGQPIPGELAMQMAQGGPSGDQSHNPLMNTQAPNPIRQQGMN
jgi:hypothetical protein